MPSARNATGSTKPGKAARGGAPSQKTCRPPRKPSNPSRKGGFVSKLLLVALLGLLLLSRLGLVAPRPRTGSSRCRRRRPRRCSRSAPASRWSPWTTSPTTRPRRPAPSSPASRRTSRRSPATGPTSSSSPTTRRARLRAPRARHPRARPGRGQGLCGDVRRDRTAGTRHGARRRGNEARHRDEAADRRTGREEHAAARAG